MNETTIKFLFCLIHSAIQDEPTNKIDDIKYTEETLSECITISKSHDVLHLLVYGLHINGVISDTNPIKNEMLKAVYRYERLNYDFENLCHILESKCITFIPLKGAVIRKYYKYPWMRTSCDIDILIKENVLDNAVKVLKENLGYKEGEQGSHDISLFSPTGNHIELHYELVEDGIVNLATKVLEMIWDTSLMKKEKQFCHEISDEMFYFYHIAHMAKHIKNGGCGIRPFIDLWVLDEIKEVDKQNRDELLVKGDLLTFANVARKLSRVWFKNEEHDTVSQQLERYILYGGVYGTTENRVVIQQHKRGGKIKFICSRIFMPYNKLKFKYPVLQKHKWLTPIMAVCRWFTLFKPSTLKRSLSEAKVSANVSKDKTENLQAFLENIGLK